MKAEIISVGTELLLGHTINTDGAIVARMLAELGIDVLHMQTVGDNPARLGDALRAASSRAELIITTGGLGPTDDDLTKNVVAAFAGVSLVEDADALLRLKEYFGSRGMSANQSRQALVPAGATVFHNATGTAPGCAVPFGSGSFVIMLPGPPKELEAMLVASVKPFLQQLSGATIFSTLIRTFGIGEGAAAEKIQDLMAGSNPTVAPYAHGGEMFVKITAKAADVNTARALCQPLVAEISSRLGEVVYGVDVASLEEVVLRQLLVQGKTIATAESCTGGLLAKRITDLPGSSAIFHLGVVTYANSAKEKLLNVSSAMLEQFGAVSPQVAEAMATGIRRVAAGDLGIGITGIAGPDGATETKPVGLVYIALSTPEQCFVRVMQAQGRYLGRAWVRERAASTALDMVRRYLTGLSPVPA